MNTEQLRVIAEGMGYKIHSVSDGIVFISHAGFRVNGFPYQPDTTNNDQMVEIMEKLEIDIEHKASGLVAYTYKGNNEVLLYSGQGKSINEAVCAAAYEYFSKEGLDNV